MSDWTLRCPAPSCEHLDAFPSRKRLTEHIKRSIKKEENARVPFHNQVGAVYAGWPGKATSLEDPRQRFFKTRGAQQQAVRSTVKRRTRADEETSERESSSLSSFNRRHYYVGYLEGRLGERKENREE